LRADSGALEAAVPGRRAITVSGFSTNSVRAVDVTDAQKPIELETTVAADGSEYRATFTPSESGTRTIFVFDSTRVLPAPELAANRPSTWNDGKSGADLL